MGEDYRDDGGDFNFATEILSDMKNDMKDERQAMKHERQTIIKYLWRTLALVICLWFATIGGFLWYISQYDYVSYAQDAGDGGTASIIGGDGDIYNGETKAKTADEKEAQ